MQQKIIWMLLLVIGIPSSLVFSCEVDGRQLQQFIYVNNSNYPILITGYVNTGFNSIKNEYLISENDSLFQEIDLVFGSTGNVIMDSDSVNVVFDNSKILRFNKLDDNIDRNILRWEGYENYRKNGIMVSRYTFSNTDYQRAEDCSNCE